MEKSFHTRTDAGLLDSVTELESVPKDHDCRRNWDKPSKAMESDMAIEEIHSCLFFIL